MFHAKVKKLRCANKAETTPLYWYDFVQNEVVCQTFHIKRNHYILLYPITYNCNVNMLIDLPNKRVSDWVYLKSLSQLWDTLRDNACLLKLSPVPNSKMLGILQNGVVCPSVGLWVSPIILLKKRKDSGTRFCVDYCKNERCDQEGCLPTTMHRWDLTCSLAGAKFFSMIDLASGYWQVVMDASFMTQHDLFEFQVMVFGLCNVPSTYQRLMNGPKHTEMAPEL